MSALPKVSYLVPSYGHARYITGTLDSIAADEYPNKEILIIDDGSKDESPRLIAEWAAKAAHLDIRFVARPNKGLCPTLNELIRMSSGELLRICSSDDYLVSGCTHKMAGALLTNPDALAIFGDASVIDENDKPVADSAIEFNGSSRESYLKDTTSSIIAAWAVSGPVLMVRRRFFDDPGNLYNETLRIDDWFMYLKLTSSNQLIFIDEKAARYRVHAQNSSRTKITDARIANQQSQLKAAKLILDSMAGRNRELLQAQIYLIKAKIAYLTRSYLNAVLYVSLNRARKLYAHSQRASV